VALIDEAKDLADKPSTKFAATAWAVAFLTMVITCSTLTQVLLRQRSTVRALEDRLATQALGV
jgi:hypothetical protein